KDGVIASRMDTIDPMNALTPNYKGKAIIPGAGHWTQQEKPDEFNAALLAFLRTL
ncbi:MAG: alpha/beta fold hydrolase, partial [Ilumatobacteraceae bacterium]